MKTGILTILLLTGTTVCLAGETEEKEGLRAEVPAEVSAPDTYVKVGETVPDFTVEMFDGRKIRMSDLKGKVVWLNFWATWCPPCRAELKRVPEEVVKRFGGEADFVFPPISRGETREQVEKFREQNGYTFAMGLDPEAQIFGLFAKQGIPRNFIIDRDGKIRVVEIGYTPAGFEELIGRVSELLQK